MNHRFALLALALCAFGIGTTEFAPMGLLTEIADDLGISIPTAGLLISAYAIGVFVGAPLLTLGGARVPRKALLLGLMGVFIVGNVLAALSASYNMLLSARVITALVQGPFFGVGAVVAGRLVPPGKQGSAIALMFAGLALANIVGVPFQTWFGQVSGWRATFWLTSVIGVVALVALWLALPRQPGEPLVKVRHELAVLGRPAVLTALLVTLLSSGGMFTVMTYISPILQHASGIAPKAIGPLLIVFGVGLALGNYLGGRIRDERVDQSLMLILALASLVLGAFAFTMHWPVAATITLFAWGVAWFATLPPLQTRIVTQAADAPNLSSAVNIGAFNLGNAIGAVIGGLVIDAGLDYSWVAAAGALANAASLLLVMFSRRRTTRLARQAA
jgi:DHA1 family inner membrane transport protein